MHCRFCDYPTNHRPVCSNCEHKAYDLAPVIFFFVDTDDGIAPGIDCTYIEIVPHTFGPFKATITPPVLP